jgi:hypothetical protein
MKKLIGVAQLEEARSCAWPFQNITRWNRSADSGTSSNVIFEIETHSNELKCRFSSSQRRQSRFGRHSHSSLHPFLSRFAISDISRDADAKHGAIEFLLLPSSCDAGAVNV